MGTGAAISSRHYSNNKYSFLWHSQNIFCPGKYAFSRFPLGLEIRTVFNSLLRLTASCMSMNAFVFMCGNTRVYVGVLCNSCLPAICTHQVSFHSHSRRMDGNKSLLNKSHKMVSFGSNIFWYKCETLLTSAEFLSYSLGNVKTIRPPHIGSQTFPLSKS